MDLGGACPPQHTGALVDRRDRGHHVVHEQDASAEQVNGAQGARPEAGEAALAGGEGPRGEGVTDVGLAADCREGGLASRVACPPQRAMGDGQAEARADLQRQQPRLVVATPHEPPPVKRHRHHQVRRLAHPAFCQMVAQQPAEDVDQRRPPCELELEDQVADRPFVAEGRRGALEGEPQAAARRTPARRDRVGGHLAAAARARVLADPRQPLPAGLAEMAVVEPQHLAAPHALLGIGHPPERLGHRVAGAGTHGRGALRSDRGAAGRRARGAGAARRRSARRREAR